MPDNEQLDRMSAALIRLCTRRHATFDKLFHSESHLPRHIAEIVRDLADMVSIAHNLPVIEGQEPALGDSFAGLTERYESLLVGQYDTHESSSFPVTGRGMLQNKDEFVSQATNEKARDELPLQGEHVNLSMDHMIFDAINDGLTTMAELIRSIGKDEVGKRQIVDAFYSEIYGNEREKTAPKIEDKGRRNEYLRNIGSIAKSAGLTMAEENSNGTGTQKPKALGVNVFQTVVRKSYYDLRSGDVGARINEMEHEISRRIQEEGLLLVAPMAKELGYPDAETFRSELRAVASNYGVFPAISDTALHLRPPNRPLPRL
ncbi:hypothetical protein [Pandoraea horticolens]|uniref:hypothetical protein n=1 Tax=Pandoraea horticolens TaxID=2508298 RepID=UPI001242EF6E|nr:hypothetical protein [Pandoraea horticolens]